MIKRIIYIGSPAKLSIKDSQLIIENTVTGEINSVPAEDIFAVEIDHYQVLITSYALSFFMENKICLIVSNKMHLPAGVMIPLEGNSVQTLRMRRQIEAPKPLLKNIWKTIVKYKIRNQALLLKKNCIEAERLMQLEAEVKSGDTGNCEAKAARYYWQRLFSFIDGFRRDPDGEYPNCLLNYGYAIVRSLAARELAAAGLHPSLGVFHKNQYNPYCLADDIMEPFRPFVDELALGIAGQPGRDFVSIRKQDKEAMLGLMFKVIRFRDESKTIINAVSNICNDLAATYESKESCIGYPLLE